MWRVAHNKQLVPTPGTTRHVFGCVRGRRGTAKRWLSAFFVSNVRFWGEMNVRYWPKPDRPLPTQSGRSRCTSRAFRTFTAMWQRSMFLTWVTLLVAVLSTAVEATSPSEIELDSVSVHLFLEDSGELSRDVTSIPDFLAWNFHPIGEGIPDGERFHSFLVKVSFYSTYDAFEPGVVAQVKITNKETGKQILARTIRGVYVGQSQISHVAVFVDGHECEQLIVEVTSPKKTIKKTLRFSCGE